VVRPQEALQGRPISLADLCFRTGSVPAEVATAGEGRRFVGTEIDAEMVHAAKLRVKAVL
jgi:hypothetical protein